MLVMGLLLLLRVGWLCRRRGRRHVSQCPVVALLRAKSFVNCLQVLNDVEEPRDTRKTQISYNFVGPAWAVLYSSLVASTKLRRRERLRDFAIVSFPDRPLKLNLACRESLVGGKMWKSIGCPAFGHFFLEVRLPHGRAYLLKLCTQQQ